MDLTGTTAMVTGAAIRVGREIALGLARAGADQVIHYHRSEGPAHSLAGEVRALGRQARLLKGDLGDMKDVEKVAREAREVDVLVNSASIFPRTPLAEVHPEIFDEIMAVNLRAPFFLSQQIGLAMKERGRGAIVNIADWSAERPHRNYLPYCLSKAGLVAMTKGLARILAPEVRVNTVAPGPVMLPGDLSPADREAVLSATPLGREGSPVDVAEAVRFLVAGSDFVTGAFLTVDGGRLIA